MTEHTKSQFHASEIAVQEKLGVRDRLAAAEGFIRPFMPDQHREFFTQLPFVMVGIADQEGFPWAMPVFGEQGFISSPDDATLQFSARPRLTSALGVNFEDGQKVGMLGIQLETRRRNRMNGVLENVTDSGFSIDVDQSFGNCPQYIQQRELTWQADSAHLAPLENLNVEQQLVEPAKQLIERSDTFFIASRTRDFDQDIRSGIDASHRGGKPGFVKVQGNQILFPDFSGNRFYNTIGNIESDGRVGLFFPDFQSGDGVLIVGTAIVHWEHPAIHQFEGAERFIQIDIEKAVFVPTLMGMKGKLVSRSPVLDNTGTWKAVQSDSADSKSATHQRFEIVERIKESEAITSFYLKPVTQAIKTKPYLAGQFLPVQLSLSDGSVVNRSYTLSRATTDDNTYRISVKREDQGLVSRMLHEQFGSGRELQVGQPAGQFTLAENNNAIVFLSGGVGVTPMIAMLDEQIRRIKQGAKIRPVWFIHGTQTRATLAFDQHVRELAEQHSWLKVHTVFSQQAVDTQQTQANYSQGRVSIDLLKEILPFDHYDFYLCGTEAFMRSLYAGLLATGVSKNNIFYEFFGAGSIEPNTEQEEIETAERAQIAFAKSARSAQWSDNSGTLLEFAEEHGLTPTYSCRSGNCGMCASKLESGEIVYITEPNYTPEEGEVLICCAKPAKNTMEISLDI